VRREGGVEAADAAEAADERDLRDRQGRVGQQLLGAEQPARLQVLQRRHAQLRLEDPAQVPVADAQPLRQQFHRRRVAAPRFRFVQQAARPAGPARRSHPAATSAAPAAPVPGRQRRQGRKPALSACAAWAKKRQFSRPRRAHPAHGRQ
jgi:hypothetical protein